MAEMQRKRREPPEVEFEDPLSNYSPPNYADDLERVLNETPVVELEHKPYGEAAPDTTVEQALRIMVEHNIACLLIVEDGLRLIGVFTERDVLNRVAGQLEQIRSLPVRAVMTPDPLFVYETAPLAKAINYAAIGGVRHIPICNVDNQVTGVIGPRRITKFLVGQFAG